PLVSSTHSVLQIASPATPAPSSAQLPGRGTPGGSHSSTPSTTSLPQSLHWLVSKRQVTGLQSSTPPVSRPGAAGSSTSARCRPPRPAPSRGAPPQSHCSSPSIRPSPLTTGGAGPSSPPAVVLPSGPPGVVDPAA